MSQPHNTQYIEKPMTTYGRTQGPSRRYRRLRHPIFLSTEWTAKNPLLQRGEIGAESDTHRLKIGDGVTYWNDLPYTSDSVATWGAINGNIADQTDLKNALDGKVSTDGSSTMTGVLKMRASISFECAIAPYWHGVGLYQLNDNDSVTLLASMETPDGWCPGTNNTFNMGSTSKKWKNLYLSGSAYVSKINNGFDIAVPVTNSADEFALKSQVDLKANIADLATVATTGDYGDLLNKPTIPTVNNATLTIQKNSTNVATFTANASSNVTADISVPTKVSDLSNDSGFITGITSSDVTTALGYTPYNSSNPNGYTSNVGTVTSVNNTSPDGSGNVSLTIPTVNDGTITVTQNGVSVGSFTLNQASGDTIALTDTTYSVMTGATAGDAGASGLVPAPAAGDQAKFLQGDGTWANPTATTAWGNITGTLSNQTDLQDALDDKANKDLSNITSAGKEVIAHQSMPSNRYVDLTVGVSGTTYTMPADGYLFMSATSTATNQNIQLSGALNYRVYSNAANQGWRISIPVSKGESVTANYNMGSIGLRFIYAEGAQ